MVADRSCMIDRGQIAAAEIVEAKRPTAGVEVVPPRWFRRVGLRDLGRPG